ncbi:MAG: ABC transporter permease subunit [Clostridia bacterium]|nr:ABC transporter permease subunit [Clostridia bacterium]
MRALLALIQKEIIEQLRSGKGMILGLLFLLFGIMNPAIAKLTPWLLEIMADSLAESGMTVTEVTVTAMDSWMQFYKNIPMGLIAFALIESNIFTKEYETGTLILSLTKGLDHRQVVLSKTLVLGVLWTCAYWLCFGITYIYNAYFWDNAIAQNLMLSVICWWIFGLWVVALMIVFSSVARTNSMVLLGTGGIVLLSYLLGLLPKCNDIFPTCLTDGNSLIYGLADPEAYTTALITAISSGALCLILSIPLFHRKQL